MILFQVLHYRCTCSFLVDSLFSLILKQRFTNVIQYKQLLKMQTTKWANKTNLGNVETLARNQAMFPDLYEEHIVRHALIELHLLDLWNLMPVELTLLWLICILLVRSNHWIFGLLPLYQDVINIERSYGKKHNRAWMC